MAPPIITTGPIVELKINGEDFGGTFINFEWASFVNGGYTVRVTLNNPYYNILNEIVKSGYLKTARRMPTEIKFKLKWAGGQETPELPAVMINLESSGVQAGGTIEFIAVDPPSFFLNQGDADGRVWEGKVSKVIEQVIQEYAPDIQFKVTETKDNECNFWPQMRMDPKTFIHSLLEWSSSITSVKDSDRWIVASGAEEDGTPKIFIHKVSEVEPVDLGTLKFNTDGPADILRHSMIANNFISAVQNKLITHGISAVSGEYLDKITDQDNEEKVFVKDENTGDKVKTDIGSDRGFAKPPDTERWATAIMAVPEFNDGSVGIKYSDYINGRPLGMFVDILNMVMRIKFRVNGFAELSDSVKLGATTVNVGWRDADDEQFFLSGKWIVYGFHHIVTRGKWVTDLYCYRIDHDAEAEPI